MLKGAIIGFGKIAQSNHMPAFEYDEIKKHMKIIAAVEPNEKNRNICEQKYSEIKFYFDVKQLFTSEQIDFVDITSPPNSHFDVLQEAIVNKVNVICEKPFTRDITEARVIADFLLDSGLHFMPCHQYKYSPIWREFKTLVDNMDENSKAHIKFDVVRTSADYGLEINNSYWRIDKEISGGGILTDTGLHYLYLAGWIMGRPRGVTCNIFNLKHKTYNVEDTVIALIEFEKGLVEISLTWAGDRRYNGARLVTCNSSLLYDGGNYLYKHIEGQEDKISVPKASDKSHYVSLYAEMFNQYFCGINENTKCHGMIEEAYQSIWLLNKCYESAEKYERIGL